MANYYAIVEKSDNKLHEKRFHIYTDGPEIKQNASEGINFNIPSLIPINQEELFYAKLNSNLINILITGEDDTRFVDTANLTFNTATNEWIEFYKTPIIPDPVEDNNKIKNDLISLTQLKLRVPDLPDSVKTIFNNYITALNAMEINTNTVGTLTWPTKPF
jgi:hypothetical protein